MRELIVLIACSFIVFASTHVSAQDYSGNWTGLVTESTSDCTIIVKAKPGQYQLRFVQTGDELTIVEDAARRPYRGFIEADNPQHVQVRGTYADAGGYVTEDIMIKFTGADSGTGQSVWKWSSGWRHCSGRFFFTLKKKRE